MDIELGCRGDSRRIQEWLGCFLTEGFFRKGFGVESVVVPVGLRLRGAADGRFFWTPKTKGAPVSSQHYYRYTRGTALICLAGLIVGMAVTLGCSSTPPRPMLDPSGETDPKSILGPGDELDIEFFFAPNLNTLQTVRRDGYITMQLVGEVQVAGLLPAELNLKLEEIYRAHLLNPQITVLVRNQWVRRIYVSGQVRRAGAVAIPAEMTALEAVMQAGGPNTDSAELSTVLIIRHQDGKRLVGSLNLATSLGWAELEPGEEMPAPFYMRPGDILYVPETKIVRVDRWLEQHIHDVFLGFGVVTFPGNSEVHYDLER